MAFVKTTWVDGALPSISAAQLNRMDQGILDAHSALGTWGAWASATDHNFTGLNGDADWAYEVLIAGQVSGFSGSDWTIFLRPNSDNGNNYAQVVKRWYQDPFGTPLDNIYTQNTGVESTGFEIARGAYQTGGPFFCRAVISTLKGDRHPIAAESTFIERGGTARMYRCNFDGWWSNTVDPVSSIALALRTTTGAVAGSFTGRTAIRRMAT